MDFRSIINLVENATTFPPVLKDRWAIAEYVAELSTKHVDEEMIAENYYGAHAVLTMVPISRLREGPADNNIPSKAKERRYAKMDPATMPPLLVDNGEVVDGNHRFRVALAAGLTEVLCYVIQYRESVDEGKFDDENSYEYGSQKTAAEYASHVWFHGTEEDIENFDPSKSRFNGMWFAENPKLTGYYGPSQYKVRLHFKNPLIVSEETYISKKPNGPSYWARGAKALGHDAVIIQDIIDGDTESTICCVFDPSIVEIMDKDLYIEEEVRLPLAKGALSRSRGFYAAMVVVMDPKDFIRLTTPANEVQTVYDDTFAKHADYKSGSHDRFNKNNYGMPFLDIDYTTGKVLGHEGRHRAAMVAKEGGTKFPCVVVFKHPKEYVLTYSKVSWNEEDNTFDWDNAEPQEQVFPSYAAAQEFWEKIEQAQADHDVEINHWYSGHKIEIYGGGVMKGSPRSQGWDRDAWKPNDIPAQFVGQFEPSVVVPTKNMKHGLVKGYTHYK